MPDSLNEQVLRQLRAYAEEHPDLEIPPKVFPDMEAEILAYQEGESLRIRFPVKERYHNPMGMMQGGMIVAAMDNTMGPLSFLVAPPSVTVQLNTTYLRPITAEEAYIEVEARVVEQAGRQLLLTADVYNTAGRRMAMGQATCTILKRR